MKRYCTLIVLSVLLLAFTASCSQSKASELTTSQVIAYRVAGIQKKAKAAILEATAAKKELETIQKQAKALIAERDAIKGYVVTERARADAAERKTAAILAHFNKLLFIASSLAACAAILSVLQIPILMGPYRLYLAAGAGLLTFAATWQILGHL